MSVNRVRVVWTGANIQGGGLSTFYFTAGVGTAQQQVSAAGAFLSATNSVRTAGVVFATLPDVDTLNIETGTLEAVTSTTTVSGTGTSAGDFCPPQTQGLLRLITAGIFGGRLLRGRIFLPAVNEVDNASNGVPSVTYRNAYDTAAATLIADTNTDWVVWSQTHGGTAGIASATTWNKWAALRSRRD